MNIFTILCSFSIKLPRNWSICWWCSAIIFSSWLSWYLRGSIALAVSLKKWITFHFSFNGHHESTKNTQSNQKFLLTFVPFSSPLSIVCKCRSTWCARAASSQRLLAQSPWVCPSGSPSGRASVSNLSGFRFAWHSFVILTRRIPRIQKIINLLQLLSFHEYRRKPQRRSSLLKN